MAISAINISQDNIVSGSNLMPVHSPFVFIAEATYSGSVPTDLYVIVYDLTGGILGQYKCIPHEDPLATVRTFLFDSAQFLRSFMEDIDDELQLNQTLEFVSAPIMGFDIEFYDRLTAVASSKLRIRTIAGAAQFSEYPNLTDIFLNTGTTYYKKVGSFVYVYLYADTAGASRDVYITDNGNNLGAFPVHDIGYYKFKTDSIGNFVVNFYDDNARSYDQNVISQGCPNDALLKYFDKTGQYRFYNFNEYYETNDKSKSIGSIEKLVTNIRTDQGNRTQIGKTTGRTISLVAEVENDQLDLVADLIASPKVYLYIGDSDVSNAWLEVEVLTNSRLIRRRIGTTGRADVLIQLPQIHNVTLL